MGLKTGKYGGQWGDVRLLSRDSVRQMTTNQLSDGQLPVRLGDAWPGMGYGLGVGVNTAHSPDQGAPAGAFGWVGVSGTRAWVFPKELVSMIAMPQAWFFFKPAALVQKLVYETISR